MGEEIHLTCASGQKVLKTEKAKQYFPFCKKNQKVNNAEAIPSKFITSSKDQKVKDTHFCDADILKTRTSRMVKCVKVDQLVTN